MKKAISVLLLIAVVLTCALAFVACNKEPEIADKTKYYETVTKKAKLTKSFEGKSFMNDGKALQLSTPTPTAIPHASALGIRKETIRL